MKTVIYEPKYLEYPGVSLPTPEYGNSSGLADLYDLPEVTPQQETEETPFSLPIIDYSVNPFKGVSSGGEKSGGESVTPATNLKGTNDKAIYLMKRLQNELNLTKEQAAGIAGNIFEESEFNPHGKPGDGGLALGIAQWHPDRRRGIDLTRMSYEDQVSYLIKELQTEGVFNKKYGGLNKLRQLRTASDAAAFIDKAYERSNGEARKRRQSYAEAYAKLKFLRGGKI